SHPEQLPRNGLYGWDGRLKLAMLAMAIGLNILVARLWLSIFLLVLGLILALFSRIPFRQIGIFFLAPAWATLVVFIGFSVGFGVTPLIQVGPVIIYQDGLQLGLAAAARVACDMAWIAAVFLTTPFNTLMRSLRWLRVPEILLDITAMAYRYAGLLWDEFHRMKISAVSRGGFRGWTNRCHSTARILSQVILRSYDRSLRIQQAMFARGQLCEKQFPDSRHHSEGDVSCPNRCNITPTLIAPGLPVLICEDVCHCYADTRSLKNLSMTVHQGEVVALCGPNGAGKSTLLKLIAGIIRPDSGAITLCGKTPDPSHPADNFQHVGLLFQDPNDQLFCTHVREDVAYGPINLGLDANEVNRRVAAAMELMEVTHLADRPIHRLSHGEMRRVGLAGVIAMQPPLILLDEPTASLDPASTQHLIRLIRHLNSHHGYTLIMVTHDINIASMIATRVIILDQGAIVADGTPRAILTDRSLLERSRLEPPLLTRLFQELDQGIPNSAPIPLTIEEALERLADMKNNHFPPDEETSCS
ncbi:MAG: cobalt ECF transporter T component CbiQ, partial [Desulfatirhabdiaceae bacterium]